MRTSFGVSANQFVNPLEINMLTARHRIRGFRFCRDGSQAGFTLIELILVIAIIGIMSALIVAAIINAASDTRKVLARQQQTVVQEALNSWISFNSSGTSSLGNAKTTYNASANRLSLVSSYLDPTTYSQFTDNTTNSAHPQTEAMAKTSQHLEFTDWTTEYPRVNMTP
ncbi:hypothetical protein BH09VER1_BH09VER1_09780 [soil metagenome]